MPLFSVHAGTLTHGQIVGIAFACAFAVVAIIAAAEISASVYYIYWKGKNSGDYKLKVSVHKIQQRPM